MARAGRLPSLLAVANSRELRKQHTSVRRSSFQESRCIFSTVTGMDHLAPALSPYPYEQASFPSPSTPSSPTDGRQIPTTKSPSKTWLFALVLRGRREAMRRSGGATSKHCWMVTAGCGSTRAALYRLTTDDNALQKGWHMSPKMAAECI